MYIHLSTLAEHVACVQEERVERLKAIGEEGYNEMMLAAGMDES